LFVKLKGIEELYFRFGHFKPQIKESGKLTG
jgi:hypothetical protein